jgi:hypothetical protein
MIRAQMIQNKSVLDMAVRMAKDMMLVYVHYHHRKSCSVHELLIQVDVISTHMCFEDLF